MRLPLLLAAVVALALVPAGCGDEDREPERDGARDAERALVAKLREGGLVLVFRHAVTETATDEQESLRSCGRQRNLSAEGRAQARAIGRDLRALGVAVGDVLASPLCRARDTARLMLGRATVERDLVSPGVIGTIDDDDRRAEALRRLAVTPPSAGTNTALFTHTGNIGGAFDLSVEEGEALVFRPAAGPPRAIARIPAGRWPQLLRAAG